VVEHIYLVLVMSGQIYTLFSCLILVCVHHVPFGQFDNCLRVDNNVHIFIHGADICFKLPCFTKKGLVHGLHLENNNKIGVYNLNRQY